MLAVCFRGNVQTCGRRHLGCENPHPVCHPLNETMDARGLQNGSRAATKSSTLEVTNSPGRVCSSKEQRQKAVLVN